MSDTSFFSIDPYDDPPTVYPTSYQRNTAATNFPGTLKPPSALLPSPNQPTPYPIPALMLTLQPIPAHAHHSSHRGLAQWFVPPYPLRLLPQPGEGIVVILTYFEDLNTQLVDLKQSVHALV